MRNVLLSSYLYCEKHLPMSRYISIDAGLQCQGGNGSAGDWAQGPISWHSWLFSRCQLGGGGEVGPSRATSSKFSIEAIVSVYEIF